MAERHEFAGLGRLLPQQRLVAGLFDRIGSVAPAAFYFVEQAVTRSSGDLDALLGSVVAATQDQNPATRADAALALELVGEATSAASASVTANLAPAKASLVRLLSDADATVRLVAVRALAHFVAVGSAEDTIISLSRASEDAHREVRLAVVETLHAFAAAAPMVVVGVLRQVIGKPGVQDADLVASAIESLRPCGPDAASDAVAELEALLKDRRVASAIRITICGLLGWLGANAVQAANTLTGIVFGDVENRPAPKLRIAAAKALLRVTDLVAVLSARPVAADHRHKVLSLLREVGPDATTARQALERMWQSDQATAAAAGTLPSADTPVADATVSAERLAGIESSLAELKKLVKAQQVPQAEKALYTVAEAAEQTGYSKFTLRQACNKERIRAEKGPDGQWRIPHAEIVKIQNEGLPKE